MPRPTPGSYTKHQTLVISVRKGLPVKDFKEFVTLLKDKGASLNFGSGGAGAHSHLLCMYLAQITGTNPTHVPYRGSGPPDANCFAHIPCNYLRASTLAQLLVDSGFSAH